MSAAREKTLSKKIDRAYSTIMQRNMCVICHLPLCYGAQDAEWITAQAYWKTIITQVGADPYTPGREIVKEEETEQPFQLQNLNSKSPSYGTWYTECNAEKCHLINTCVTLEITPLNIFCSPLREYTPDPSFYYKHTSGPVSLIAFTEGDMVLLTTMNNSNINSKALARLNDWFNVRGVLYFLACKDCNFAHTGEAGLRHLFRDNYGLPPHQLTNFYLPQILYTLLFDSACDNRRKITFTTDNAFASHKLRMWLHYAMIMFWAQQKQGMIKAVGPKYYAKNAHRDIGVCDFYMGQIIGAILYANYDIPYSFDFLYGTCLCFLAHWAKQNGVYVCSHEQRSLWRWVLSDESDTHTRTESFNDSYWIDDSSFKDRLKTSIKSFARNWIPAIGYAILNKEHAPIDVDPILYNNLKTFIRQRLTPQIYQSLRKVAAERDNNSITLTNWFMEQPSISSLRVCLQRVFPQIYKNLLWENFATLSWRRTLHWADMLYNNLTPRMWQNFKHAVAMLLNAA